MSNPLITKNFESLFQGLDNEINHLRYIGGRYRLKGHQVFKLHGADATDFLQNFSTSNIKDLKANHFVLTTRLNIKGRFLFFFYVLKDKDDSLFCLLPKEYEELFKNELDKFLIAEDVEFDVYKDNFFSVYFDPMGKLGGRGYKGQFLGESVVILNQEQPLKNVKKISHSAITNLSYLTGLPLGPIEPDSDLINNLMLNEAAVDYSKGCFLGQETASKIHFNRGPAHYPMLIKFRDNMIDMGPGDKILFQDNNEKKSAGQIEVVFFYDENIYACAKIKREFLYARDDVEIYKSEKEESFTGSLIKFPFFLDISSQQKSVNLMELGQICFQEDNMDDAISLLSLLSKEC